ncbi:MAG: inorganic phosphate transporter [Bacteroidales bacterium]|nr:inorganic phosphate transporter [Bacteroidales bacterium]
MTTYYLILVIILFVLAFSDLMIGVSNDAVNFLNSAIGSKVAPVRIIMLVAALGILIGATFSSGMMEVARSGIMNPGAFTFAHIMIIFLAVMISDVLLLDLFNTFGLPTSTTVSIVFELLGASVGMAIINIANTSYTLNDLGVFINSEKVLLIIAGILLSVAIAFTVGVIVQYIARIIFSFNFKNTLRYFGSVWGGLAIASITYFILIKGAKGSSFINDEQLLWIQNHSTLILGTIFAFCTLLLQLLYWLFRVNVFKVIVLFGTFALAMAFAGNDLVNFIGVPLAGFESFKIFTAQHGNIASEFTMNTLAGEVKTPTMFLLVSGIVMAVTLWFSHKARSVVQTSLNLGNQDIINERFSSSLLSRSLVRIGVQSGYVLNRFLPDKFRRVLNTRFDDKAFKKQAKKDKGLAFDLVRASVNLVVASSLIAFATSFQLPLSTTYVTFMVAMGTSLADRAWGRESAVYRVSGVITVIGGWFFTAFSAFTLAFIMALLINLGGPWAIGILILAAITIIYRTHILHRKREAEVRKMESELGAEPVITGKNIYDKCNLRVINSLNSLSEIYSEIMLAFIGEKRKKLNKANKEVRKLNREIKSFKKNAHEVVLRLQEKEPAETGEYYVQMLDYLRETAHCLTYISEPAYNHIDNNHEPLQPADAEDFTKFLETFRDYISGAVKVIASRKFENIDKLYSQMYDLINSLSRIRKNHIKRIKGDGISTRVSMLYLDILAETKNLILYSINLVKTSRDFSASANSVK